MKVLPKIFRVIALIAISVSFAQCKSTMKLQQEPPATFTEVYYQSWVAGVRGGGAGVNIFIETTSNNLVLDSVYFRGNVSKLEVKPGNPALHIGRFNTGLNQAKDIILSSDPKEEYTNKISKATQSIPFELKGDECVVSYSKGGKVLYYKIPNVIEKAADNYPSAPPNTNKN